MQTNNYSYAQQNWQSIDPQYQNQFISHKVTRTTGGSQTVESQQPMKTGIMGKLGNIAHRGQEMLGMTGNAQSRWALFGVSEPILAEYPAKTAYGEGSRLGGWIYLSENHFGWISHTDSMNRVVKTLIPFSNVTNIIPSSRVRGVNKGTYKFVPITAPGVRPDGFQMLTKDGLMYQFFGMKNIELVFNLLNSQWQSKYATGFQSGLQQGGFTSGSYASTAQSYPQTQTFAQTAAPMAPVSTQTYPQQTSYVSQQQTGKMATHPFQQSVQQDPNYGTKDVHSYAGGHVQTFAPHHGGNVAYQPAPAPANLGQTAPGQRQGYY